jgi:hypothetical protein
MWWIYVQPCKRIEELRYLTIETIENCCHLLFSMNRLQLLLIVFVYVMHDVLNHFTCSIHIKETNEVLNRKPSQICVPLMIWDSGYWCWYNTVLLCFITQWGWHVQKPMGLKHCSFVLYNTAHCLFINSMCTDKPMGSSVSETL